VLIIREEGGGEAHKNTPGGFTGKIHSPGEKKKGGKDFSEMNVPTRQGKKRGRHHPIIPTIFAPAPNQKTTKLKRKKEKRERGCPLFLHAKIEGEGKTITPPFSVGGVHQEEERMQRGREKGGGKKAFDDVSH